MRRARVTKRTGIRAPTEIELENISLPDTARHRGTRCPMKGPRPCGSLSCREYRQPPLSRGRGMRCSSVLCSLALTFGIVAPVIVAAQGGSVAGTVVNRATGAPVAAAQVTVAGTALRAFTDASGKFALNEVPGAP